MNEDLTKHVEALIAAAGAAAAEKTSTSPDAALKLS